MKTKTQKTQVSGLRNGSSRQMLNPDISYYRTPTRKAHDGVAGAGSNHNDVARVWEEVVAENPKTINVVICGVPCTLYAHKSVSGKTTTYEGAMRKEALAKFGLVAPTEGEPSISIQCANIVIVRNGKKDWTYVCPSLVKIM